MTLTEDVGSEVRRILTNNTVDQCMQYYQTIKRDIANAQDELRDVIGQRYRELLHACDRVVGMDDICRSIEQSYQKGSEQMQRRQQQASSSSSAALVDGGSSSTTTTAAIASAMTNEDQNAIRELMMISDCEDLHRSSRVLMTQHMFADSARAYMQLMGTLSDVEAARSGGGSASNVDDATRSMVMIGLRSSVSIFVKEMQLHMMRTLSDVVGNDLNRLQTTSLTMIGDMQTALEIIYACSPATALEKLMDLCHSTFERVYSGTDNEAQAVQNAHKIRNVMLHLCWYLAHVNNAAGSSVEGIGRSEALRLEDLVHLDRSNPSQYLKTLSLHMCGHRRASARCFSHNSSSSSSSSHRASDGWALSPATSRPPVKVPVEPFHALERVALETIHKLLCEFVTTPEILAATERSLILSDDNAVVVINSPWYQSSKWALSIKESITAALRLAVQNALTVTEQAMEEALVRLAASPTDGSMASSGLQYSPSSSTNNNSVVDTILVASGWHQQESKGMVSGAAAAGKSEGELTRCLNRVAAIATATLGSNNKKESGPANTSRSSDEAAALSAAAASIVPLLAESAARIAAQLAHAVERLSSSVSPPESSGGVVDEAAALRLSHVCDLVLDVFSTVLSLLQRTSVEASTLLESSLAKIDQAYVQCHTSWLDHVLDNHSVQRMIEEYDAVLFPSHQQLILIGSSSSSSQDALISAAVKASLINVWRTQRVEDTSVSFPAAATPGLTRVLFHTQMRLHDRRRACGNTLRDSLIQTFGARLIRSHAVAVSKCLANHPQQHSSGAASSESSIPSSMITQEGAFQLCFDLLFINRLFGTASSSLRDEDDRNQNRPLEDKEAQQVLQHLRDVIDVIDWRVAYPLMSKAVADAALQQALSFGQQGAAGLALSPSSTATTLGSSSSTSSNQSNVHYSILLEDEADRLPLLPITTPTQVRNMVSSLHGAMMSFDRDGASNGNNSVSNGSSSSSLSASSATASLWSATTKLRSFWGQ